MLHMKSGFIYIEGNYVWQEWSWCMYMSTWSTNIITTMTVQDCYIPLEGQLSEKLANTN